MIFAIFVAIMLAFFYSLYVGIIKKRNKMREALSSIEVQLHKRFDLIPNILTLAKKYMEHEKELLEEVTRLRAGQGSDVPQLTPEAVEKFLGNAAAVEGKMSKVMVAIENYPELKADETMQNAQKTYVEMEAHIAAARRFYNSAVNDLNNAVEIFPGSMIAGMIGIGSMPYYDAPEEVQASVSAADYL